MKDVLFLIMYPRDAAGRELGYPNEGEEKAIRSWFREVPLKFEY